MRGTRVVNGVPHVKTDRSSVQVEKLAALGLAAAEIAYVIGASEREIIDNYDLELCNGMAVAVAKVGKVLIKQCMKGDVNAIRFFLQARAKWVIPTKIETGTADAHRQDEAERAAMIKEIVSMVNGEKKHVAEMSPEAKLRKAKPPASDVKLN